MQHAVYPVQPIVTAYRGPVFYRPMASPVTIYCSKRGFDPVKCELSSTLEQPGGLFGFFKSVMIGKGQRYPPMVHVVLPHSRSNTKSEETLTYNRQLIKSNWKLLKRGREI